MTMRALLDRSNAVSSANVMATFPSAPVDSDIAEINRVADFGLTRLSASASLNDHGIDVFDRDRTCRADDFSDGLYRAFWTAGRAWLSCAAPAQQESRQRIKWHPLRTRQLHARASSYPLGGCPRLEAALLSRCAYINKPSVWIDAEFDPSPEVFRDFTGRPLKHVPAALKTA